MLQITYTAASILVPSVLVIWTNSSLGCTPVYFKGLDLSYED